MLGDKIKKLRVDGGLTQKELAEKLFVTPQAVSRWENGEVEPSLKTIKEMAEIFNVSVDSIVNEKYEQTEKQIKSSETLEVATQENHQPVQVALALCYQCNKPIYESSDIVRKTFGVGNDRIFCKACDKKNIQQRRNERTQQGIKYRNRSFIWGGILTALITLFLILCLGSSGHAEDVVFAVVFGIFFFPLLSCLFLKNNFVGEMIETVVGWGFVRLPGLIFTLDLDGIIWLLTVKLLFWILGLILSIICFILAITLGYITSLFVYPFAIAKSFKHPDRYED